MQLEFYFSHSFKNVEYVVAVGLLVEDYIFKRALHGLDAIDENLPYCFPYVEQSIPFLKCDYIHRRSRVFDKVFVHLSGSLNNLVKEIFVEQLLPPLAGLLHTFIT